MWAKVGAQLWVGGLWDKVGTQPQVGGLRAKVGTQLRVGGLWAKVGPQLRLEPSLCFSKREVWETLTFLLAKQIIEGYLILML